MKTIAFMRTGQVLRLGSSMSTASPLGDQRDAAGLLEYLSTKYKVIVFGMTRDIEEYENPNVKFVVPELKDMDHYSTIVDVERIYSKATAELASYEPELVVQSCGAAGCATQLDNPHHAGLQAWIMRYVGPAIHAIHYLNLPRICVNNDPRNYPKEAEITYWPNVAPVAMLSQETRTFHRKIWEKNYAINAVYSRAENWWSYGSPYSEVDNERTIPCGLLAHSHIDDGRLKKGRDDTWYKLLTGLTEYEVHGKGWETFSGYNNINFPGTLKPHEVPGFLRNVVCGPIVPCADGFLTGKLRMYVLHGAAPLLYGRGEYLTYDNEYRYVPQDSPFRVCNAAELKAAIHLCNTNETLRQLYIDNLRAKTEPDFTMIDECIESNGNGDFGGYEEL